MTALKETSDGGGLNRAGRETNKNQQTTHHGPQAQNLYLTVMGTKALNVLNFTFCSDASRGVAAARAKSHHSNLGQGYLFTIELTPNLCAAAVAIVKTLPSKGIITLAV
jgi:hypothetical protein